MRVPGVGAGVPLEMHGYIEAGYYMPFGWKQIRDYWAESLEIAEMSIGN